MNSPLPCPTACSCCALNASCSGWQASFPRVAFGHMGQEPRGVAGSNKGEFFSHPGWDVPAWSVSGRHQGFRIFISCSPIFELGAVLMGRGADTRGADGSHSQLLPAASCERPSEPGTAGAAAGARVLPRAQPWSPLWCTHAGWCGNRAPSQACLPASQQEGDCCPRGSAEAATSQTQNHQPCQLGNVLQVVGARGPRGRQGGLSPSPEPGSSLRPVRSCSSTSCQLRDPGDLKFPGWVGSCLPLQHVWAPRPHRRGRQRGSVYSSGQREAAAGCLRGVQQKRSFPGALGCHLLENRCHNSINLASIRMGTAPPRNVRVLPPGAGDVALAEPRGRAEDIKVSDSLHSIPDPEKLLIGGDADELSRRGAGNTLWRPGWLFR